MGTSTIRWMVLCVIGLAGCTANQQSVYRHRTLNSEPSVSAGVLITDGREQSDYYWVHDITRDDGTVHRDADICRGSPASVFAMTGKTVTGNTGVSKGSVGLGLDQNYGYGLTESGGQLEKSQFQQSQDGFYQSIYPLYVTGRISLDRYYQLLLIQARTFIAEYGIQQIRDVGLTSRRLPFASSSAPNLQDNIGKIDTAQKRVDASKKAADSAASTLKSALGDKTQCSELETGKQADCAKAKAAADAAAGTLKADQAQLSALQDATKALVQSAASGATQQSSDTEPGIAMSDPSAKLAIAAIKDITEKAMQFDVTSILCLMSKTQLTEEQRRACVDPTNTSPIAPIVMIPKMCVVPHRMMKAANSARTPRNGTSRRLLTKYTIVTGIE